MAESDILSRLAEARKGYKDFVEAVEADLKVEKAKRLAARQGEIMEMVAQAFVNGESKRAIMAAYGTKDFRTVQKVLDSMESQIKQMQDEKAGKTVNPNWIEAYANLVYLDGTGYDVTELENVEYLLTQVEGDPSTWDGAIVSRNDAGDYLQIWRAINQERS